MTQERREQLLEVVRPYATLSALAWVALTVYAAAALAACLRRLTGPKLPPKWSPLLDLPLPIIGGVLNVVETIRFVAKKDLVARTGSELVRVPFLAGTAIAYVSKEGVKIGVTTRHNGKKVLSSQSSPGLMALWGRKSLPNLSGTEHGRVKKVVHPTVSAKVLATYTARMEQGCLEWARSVVEPSLGKPNKVVHAVRSFMMTMPLRLILGLGDSAPEVVSQVGDMLVALWDGTFAVPLPIPGTMYAKGLQARKALEPILKDLIAERRSNPEGKSDTLSEMIRAGQLTEEEIQDQVVTIMLAAFETTAAVMCVALQMLPSYPEVMAKLRAEHEGIASPVDWATCDTKMPYTYNVFKECLRIKSPVPLFFRNVQETFEVGGYTIPVGYIYQFHLSAVQRDCCEEPDKLIPERHDDPTSPLNQPYGFTPFGGGEYLCLGERFAKMETFLFLRALVTQYTWTNGAANPQSWYNPFFLRFTDDLPLVFERLPQ